MFFKHLIILHNPKKHQKADSETSRLLFKQLCHILPIKSVKKYSKLRFFLISKDSHFWNYPHFLRTNIGIIWGYLHVRFGLQLFRKSINRQTSPDCISWLYWEQDVPHKNNNISDRTRGMTGVDPNTKYEKTPTGCRGFFIASWF